MRIDSRSGFLGFALGLLAVGAVVGCGGETAVPGSGQQTGADAGSQPPADGGNTEPDGGNVAGPDGGQVEPTCPDGETECADGCADLDSDDAHCGSCENACGEGERCSGGECVCADECPADGTRECAGEGWRVCGQHDSDSCLEWSPVTACQAGLVCDGTKTCREPCGDYCDAFSVMLLPDTQNYRKQADNSSNTYRKQTQWIADHFAQDDIRMVIHLGDITNDNLTEQWTLADHAHDTLDAAGVPYSMTTGNHDYRVTGGWDRGETMFDDYFGKSRFQGRAWYGGTIGSSNANNYTFFEVGPMKFMVVSLEYAPRKDTLCRADKLIRDHPDRRVIVATHCYLTMDGAYAGCPDADYQTLGANGRSTWQELVSRHSNIFMVVSGHVGESAHAPRTGNNGNLVHQMVVDYQFEAACTASSASSCTNHCSAGTFTGNGWLRQLVFDPRGNEVRALTFTVEDGNRSIFPGGVPELFCSEHNTNGHNKYPANPSAQDHLFSFAYDLSTPPSYVYSDAGDRTFIDRTVNSVSAGDQFSPRVAVSAAGASVVVWEDDSSSADGTGNHDVLARGFAAGGCPSFADITVNVETAGQQKSPEVAADSAGNFVVVWADDKDGNGVFQIFARGFNADGTQRFGRITVNSVDDGQQSNPAIAMAPDGRFVVAWEDDPENDGTFRILLRGFNADGTQRFADQNVSADSQGTRLAPSVGSSDDGGFVVAWQDDTDGNGGYQVHARGFNADGTQRFARVTVNSVGDGQQLRPSVGVAADGRFVVAWEDDQDSNGKYQILARGFGANGAVRIAEFAVAGTAGGDQRLPTVAMTGDGSFVTVWQDDTDADGNKDVKARAFLADGSQWKAQWAVNRNAFGQQLDPGAALTPGTVVSAWQDDVDANGTFQILADGLELP